MKLFECRRDDDDDSWRGALLIFADDMKEARSIFKENEYNEEPYSIREIELEKGIIYNDESR